VTSPLNATSLAELALDPSSRDPAPVIAELREHSPVHWLPGLDAWVVTRHEDVRMLFSDPRVTADPRSYERYEPPGDVAAERWLAEMPFRSSDDAEPSLGRRLVSAAFTPRAVARMQQCVADVVEELAAPLRGRSGVVDLLGELTEPIARAVIGHILGVPPTGEGGDSFVKLARKATRAINPFLPPAKRAQTEQAGVEMGRYVLSLIAERRQTTRADLISDLVLASRDDTPATDEEIAKVIAGIVSAGTGTAGITGARALRTLLRHPDQLATLRADRSILPGAVEELMRYDSGVFGMPRYVREGFLLRGQSLRRGQLVVLSLTGANRDPSVFPDPDRLDLRRNAKEALSFGHGAHYCIGANLARIELQRMLGAALDLIPLEGALLEEEIRWSTGGILSQLRSLPVDFGN